MCVNPQEISVDTGGLPFPKKRSVSCRRCWQCIENNINDYVGRSLAEAAYSDWSVALTLTYAPRDDLADKVITPSHFQLFMKSLRKGGTNVRYIVCGEYGALKGRAHFHCILFGKGERPDIPANRNTHVKWWPHGHVYADWSSSRSAVRYVCKYIKSDQSAWFSVSKKPPLGDQFFKRLAQRFVEENVYPRSFKYMPAGGDSRHSYIMTRATRDRFIERWLGYLDQAGKPFDPARSSEQVADAVALWGLRDMKNKAKLFDPIYERVAFEESLDENRPSISSILTDQRKQVGLEF